MIGRLRNSLCMFVTAIAVLSCSSFIEFEGRQKTVSMDPGVLTEKLENGFTYFLRSNNATVDSDRIEVRLIVKTGSLHEDDDELGYAHLLEHMAFRGTENFDTERIESIFDGVGLRWGTDVNATTHYGATVYRFSLHQEDVGLLPQLFLLMNEWLDSITFDPKALEREKRIVEAEWRERYAVRGFVVEPATASAFSGSRYAERPPVGDLRNIRAATVDSLKRFWQKHYRPDNAALIVTGSKHPWSLEPLIRETFSPVVENFVSRNAVAGSEATGSSLVNDYRNNRYELDESRAMGGTFADKGMGDGSMPGTLYFDDGGIVELFSHLDASAEYPELSLNYISSMPEQAEIPFGAPLTFDTGTAIAERFKSQLLFGAYTHLLSNQLLKTSRCDAVGLETTLLESGQVVEHVKIRLTETDLLHCLSVSAKAVESLLTIRLTDEEFQSMQRHFSSIAADIISRYRNRDASELAENLADALVIGESLLSVIDMQRVFNQVIADISRKELNEKLQNITIDHRLMYSLRSNRSAPVSQPKMAEALRDREPHNTERKPVHLAVGSLKGDQTRLEIPELHGETDLVVKVAERDGFHQWRLRNGAKVFLLNDTSFEHFAVTAISAGGYASDSAVHAEAARLLPEFLAINGVDGYLNSSLGVFKKQNQIIMEPFVDPLVHGISANGYQQNLSSVLTLLDGYFSEPMVLQPQTDNFLRRSAARKPGVQWYQTLFNTDGRATHKQSLDVPTFREAHHSLFGSPSEFGFVFVGNLDAANLEHELQRLARGSRGDFVYNTAHNSGSVATTLMVNNEANGSDLSLFMACPVLDKESAFVGGWEVLSDIVTTRMRLEVREKNGLVYDIDNEVVVAKGLIHQVRLSVAPDDVENVRSLLQKVLDSFNTDPISNEEFQRAIKRKDKARMFRPGDYYNTSIHYANRWLTHREPGMAETVSIDLETVNRLAKCVVDAGARYVTLKSIDSYLAESIGAPRSDESAFQK